MAAKFLAQDGYEKNLLGIHYWFLFRVRQRPKKSIRQNWSGLLATQVYPFLAVK
jgi:hypothetical protein